MFRIAIFAVCLSFLITPLTAQKKSMAAEEAAIKQVIENESKYFWGRDLKNWKKTYVHAPYVVWTSSSRDGVRRYEGWDAWLQEVEELFAQSPDPIPYEGVKKTNYRFRIYGDGAWVSFEQDDQGSKTIETRIMEKENGKWKIAMVQLIFNANEELDEGAAETGEN